MNIFGDPGFWVAISTALCFGFIGWKAYRPILSSLDARTESIRVRLAEADALRDEAQKVLEEYKEKSANALKEAQEVLQNAQRRAEQLRQKMEEELTESIARQEANATSRLARLEMETIESVKNAVIDAALKRVQSDISQQDVSSKTALTQSLDHITKTMH